MPSPVPHLLVIAAASQPSHWKTVVLALDPEQRPQPCSSAMSESTTRAHDTDSVAGIGSFFPGVLIP